MSTAGGCSRKAQLGAVASAIGVDETTFARATAHHSTVFATGVVDLEAPGSSISSPVGAKKCWRTGFLLDPTNGPWVSVSLHWIRSAATVTPCRQSYPTRRGCSTHSMSYGVGFAAVDDVADASNSTPVGIAAVAATRCMEFGESCAAADARAAPRNTPKVDHEPASWGHQQLAQPIGISAVPPALTRRLEPPMSARHRTSNK